MTTQTSSTVAHATFVVERTFDAPIDRVWDAFAVPEQHAQWFGSEENFTETEAHEDFRVGGQAVQDGQWHGGPTSRYVATYTDIVERRRIVSTYDMWVGGEHLSTSLTTTELAASARPASAGSSRPSRRTWPADARRLAPRRVPTAG
jgi:uncharacterized protein YndB with AHSA1/START domain